MLMKRVIGKEERTVECPFCHKIINLDNLSNCNCIHIWRAENNPNIADITPHGGPYYELFNVWFKHPCWYAPIDIRDEINEAL